MNSIGSPPIAVKTSPPSFLQLSTCVRTPDRKQRAGFLSGSAAIEIGAACSCGNYAWIEARWQLTLQDHQCAWLARLLAMPCGAEALGLLPLLGFRDVGSLSSM